MAIKVWEKVGRQFEVGDKDRRRQTWFANGSEDEGDIQQALEDAIPETYLGLSRAIDAEELGNGLWQADVTYSDPTQSGGGGGDPPPNEMAFSFDTSGGTSHITQSNATKKYNHTNEYDAPDYQGAINVTDDGIDGVDIVVPSLKIVETWTLNIRKRSEQRVYAKALSRMTGRTNDAPFREFARGELLFLGAQGAENPSGYLVVTYNWDASENIANLKIGDIIGIKKEGWEYLWIRYGLREDGDAKRLVQRPLSAYVERVYDYGDYSTLRIGRG